MATQTESSDGIVLDTDLIRESVQYYAVIGAGLGFIGFILLSQLGSGGGPQVGIVGGMISLMILAFTFLSGPLIAAFVGFATARNNTGTPKQRSVNSAIANGVGFAACGVVVSLILWLGLALFGGGSLDMGTFLPLFVFMAIPNALVGGAITFFLDKENAITPS